MSKIAQLKSYIHLCKSRSRWHLKMAEASDTKAKSDMHIRSSNYYDSQVHDYTKQLHKELGHGE